MSEARRLVIAGCAGSLSYGVGAALQARGWTFDFIHLCRDESHVPELISAAERYYRAAPDDGKRITEIVDSLFTAGKIDGLVNILAPMSQTATVRRDFLDQSSSDWRRLIDVNIYGVLNVTRAVLSQLRLEGRGAVVSVTSDAGLRGVPRANAYSATHAGIRVFTQCMAQDCGDHGVRINCVSAGEQEFPATDSTAVSKPPPLGRGDFGADVGAATAFLLSSEASHISGSCIDVSGGWSLY